MTIRLTSCQTVIAWKLATNKITTRDELVYAAWGSDGDDWLNTALHRLRHKFRPLGISIRNRYGQGWYVNERDALHFALVAMIETGGAGQRGGKIYSPAVATAWLHSEAEAVK